MREIEIQATISRSLYREMVYFQMFRRKRTTLPFGIVAYLLAAGTVIAKLTGYYTVDSYAFGMFTFYACVIYLFFPPVLIGLLEYQIHRMSTGDKTVVGQSHRIVFNENGVASYVGKAAGKFTWKQVLEAYELKNAFLFYISQSQALALAKSDATPGSSRPSGNWHRKSWANGSSSRPAEIQKICKKSLRQLPGAFLFWKYPEIHS